MLIQQAPFGHMLKLQKYGAEVIENNKVNELKQRVDGCGKYIPKKER